MTESDSSTSASNVGEMYLVSSSVWPPTTTLPLVASSTDFTRLTTHTTCISTSLLYVSFIDHIMAKCYNATIFLEHSKSKVVSESHVQFCSLAVLDPRVGHTMDVLSPFISVLCHSDWLFDGESCPRLDVVHPGVVWSSSPVCTCESHTLIFISEELTQTLTKDARSLIWRYCITYSPA